MTDTDTPSKEEWTQYHQNLIELFDRIYPDKRLLSLLNSTELRCGAPAFRGLRTRANERRQNIRRRSPSRNSRVYIFTERDLYPFFKKSPLLNDLLRLQHQQHQHPPHPATTMAKASTKKKSKEGSDDDNSTTAADASVDGLSDNFYNWGGLKDHSSVKSNSSASKKTLKLSFNVVGNPFDIKLTMGASRRQSDDGSAWSSALYISLPLADVSDINETSIQLDTKNEIDKHGNSSILLLTKPVVSMAEVQAMQMRMAQFGKDINKYYEGNSKGITESNLETTNQTRLQNCKSVYAKLIDKRTKKGKIVTYSLKLPTDPLTGRQLYCHNDFWQGADHTDAPPNDSAYLSGSFQPHCTKQKYNKRTLSIVFMSLDYKVALVGGEESELDSVITPLKGGSKVDANEDKIDSLLDDFFDDAEDNDSTGMNE